MSVSSNEPALIPVSVLTGFLGSGKTTVLNHLVQQSALERTLVLINEFGEIGLDHDLFTRSADDVVVEMSSGCLCCTIHVDLTKTLNDAPYRFARGGEVWFDRVIIETTGLADPAPILHTLISKRAIARRYRLDTVIATVDAVNGNDTLDKQVESVKQAAMADTLLVTKADIADPDALSQLQARLKALNPAAPQVAVQNGVVDPDLFFSTRVYDPHAKSADVQAWLKAEAYDGSHAHEHHHHDHQHQDVNRHDAHIKSYSFTIDEPIAPDALDAWLESLLSLQGADLLRMKGIINVSGHDGPTLLHGVQHIAHAPATLAEWPSYDHRSRLVFITRDIEESVIRDTLGLLTNSDARHS